MGGNVRRFPASRTRGVLHVDRAQPEAEAKAAQIPDIAARLEHFINEQYALEQWRAKHTRPEVSQLVQEALAAGTALKASGVDRDALFARLLTLSESSLHHQEPG